MLLGNVITKNNVGISCLDHAQATLSLNQIIGNKMYGISVGGDGIIEIANGNNTIHDNQQYDFCNKTTRMIDATGNHWGMYDAAVIDYKIYDNEEDINSSEVIFQPFQLSFVELPIDDNIFNLKLAPLKIDIKDKNSQLEEKERTPRRKAEAISKFQIDDKMSPGKPTILDNILTDKALEEDKEILQQSVQSKMQTGEIEQGINLAKLNETQQMGIVIEDTLPVDIPHTIVGKDGAEMVLIPPGEFLMGSVEKEGSEDEHPQHRVYVKAFYIDQHEVTNAQYRQFIEETKYREPDFRDNSYLNHPGQPVVGVSWDDAAAYAKWAQKRLPTEAEWEKAARGGLEGKQYPWGDNFPDVSGYKANYYIIKSTPLDAAMLPSSFVGGNSAADGYQYTAPVGSFPPNGYGLYDMAGNISEWVADWYDEAYYLSSPKQNPQGPQNGRYRVIRGGAWDEFAYDLRCANRDVGNPNKSYLHVGFRCAKDATP
jgi:formylglycine-generating enzyme required for sulfatase activity